MAWVLSVGNLGGFKGPFQLCKALMQEISEGTKDEAMRSKIVKKLMKVRTWRCIAPGF
jgi:hypothetical protein